MENLEKRSASLPRAVGNRALSASSEGVHNPYTRCKTSRVIRGGRMFDIHIYYRNLNIRAQKRADLGSLMEAQEEVSVADPWRQGW